MTSDLGLAVNLFVLGLAAESYHIYPGHMTAFITVKSLKERRLPDSPVTNTKRKIV